MVVEDEPDIGMIVSEILGSHYEVVRAANGLEALDRLNWYQPDLTIMDLMMPVLDGFDTTRAIKKDNEYAAMPVMFLTARKDNQAVREALMAGGDVYLEKPFDPPELLIRLREMVDRSGLLPRPKQYTMEQIRNHFNGVGDKTMNVEPPVPPGELPLTAQLARAAAEPKARVLVISNSDTTVDGVKKQLKGRHEVIATQDPEAALDKIAAYQPDILVVEVQMPTFNGFHLAQLLKINRQMRVPGLLFLSKVDDEQHRAEAARLKGRLITGETISIESISREVTAITQDENFTRQRKRLDYREILRREDPTDSGFE